MLYIQHYIKTIHFWLKYNGLAIVRKTTKLIEGGHRGLQEYTIQYNTVRVFSAPYTRNRTWRHYNSNKMCVE